MTCMQCVFDVSIFFRIILIELTMSLRTITNIPQVMTELMRSIHGLADMDTNLQFMNSMRINRLLKNNDSVVSTIQSKS